MRQLFSILAVIFLLTGCGINPVTGERELSLVSEQKEIAIGNEQYLASQQMQGGAYNLDRELTRYVDTVGQRLAAVSDRHLPYEFVVLNNSVPNAWALPGGKIAVNRGLLVELQNEAELAAVLGHEIIHAAARHGAKGIERGILLQSVVHATGIAAGSDYSQLAVGGASLAAGLISQKYSRDAERESDFYGMQYMSRAGYDPEAAVTLQETFVRLADNNNQNWLNGLFASHPPSMERVLANKQTLKQLPRGGELGQERYQAKIAPLRKTQDAYEAYDKGRKALQEGNYELANSLAAKALSFESREALFYGLKADTQYATKNYTNALSLYNNAIDRNSQFFQFYVQRGLTRKELGNLTGAEQDLQYSLRLLPTATAYNSLGEISLAKGQRQEAKKYFKAAAPSTSLAGKQAAASLIKLDFPDNPQAYIKVSHTLDQGNILRVKIENSTPFPVQDIRIDVIFTDERQKPHQTQLLVNEVLQGGQALLLPAATTSPLTQYRKNIRMQVVSARMVDN